MQFLAEQWGTVFLLMTATQPIIGQGKELAQNVQPFPVSRHTYQYVEERITVDDLPHLLEDRLPIHEGCGLIVLNTKKSAYEAWLSFRGIFMALSCFCPGLWLQSTVGRQWNA